jgi:hypothetical protein
MDRNNFMDRRHLNYSHGQPLGSVGIQSVSSGESEDTSKHKEPDIRLQSFGWCPSADRPQFHSQVSYCLHEPTTFHLYIRQKSGQRCLGVTFQE